MQDKGRTIYKQIDHLPATVAEITEKRNTCNAQDDVDELVTIPMMPMNKSHNICTICILKKKPYVCIGESSRLSVFINQGVLLKEWETLQKTFKRKTAI